MTELVLKSYENIRRNLEWLNSIWLISALIPILVLGWDTDNTIPFISTALTALLGTLPYILIAVLLIGYLKASGAESSIAKAFEGRETRMIVLASLFGGLAPFCSCEVIPFVAGLLAVGAPLPAVMAFWLSSPLIDPPTVLITASALGWQFAIGKGIAAIALGLFGGFTMSILMKGGAFANPVRADAPGTSSCCGVNPFTGKPNWKFWGEADRRQTFRNQSFENLLFLIKWLTFAYMLEAILIHYVPADLIASVVGGEGIGPIIIGALVGAPAYLNSYAAPPLVAGLMEQGMSPGSAMAFMVAGAVSSIPAMAAVWSLVKRQVFAAYVLFGITGAIIFGVIFQAII